MNKYLLKVQAILLHSAQALTAMLFVLYLGFMTQFYILFYDGTFEMFEYYKKLQVLNREGLSLTLQFILFLLILAVFELHKLRPGLFGLAAALSASVFIIYNSFLFIDVIPKYKVGYLALDFSSMETYRPTVFVFDFGVVLYSLLIIIMVLLTGISMTTFIQRIREGNPLIRRIA